MHWHLIRCFPCYQEFRAFQQAGPAQPPVATDTWPRVAATAAVVVAVAGTWFLFTANPRPIARTKRWRQLRPVNCERTRPRSSLTILLPVGSQQGVYEVQVLDSELRSRAAATGQAEIRDFVTTLQPGLTSRPLSRAVPTCRLASDGRMAALSRTCRIVASVPSVFPHCHRRFDSCVAPLYWAEEPALGFGGYPRRPRHPAAIGVAAVAHRRLTIG